MNERFFILPVMLKASAAEEGGARFIYTEASRESTDVKGEIVLSKAIEESVDVFMKFGVVDLDHKSMPSVAQKLSIECPDEWIIGQPEDVKFSNGSTFVKARLRTGSSPLAANANIVWESLTKIDPPTRYYASVGGTVLADEMRYDMHTGEKVKVITKTRWNNLALSLNPVHHDLFQTSTTPIGVFAKSVNGIVLKRALEAGHDTDVAELDEAGALRGRSQQELNELLSRAIITGVLGDNPGRRELERYVVKKFKCTHKKAVGAVDQFMFALQSKRKTVVDGFGSSPYLGIM